MERAELTSLRSQQLCKTYHGVCSYQSVNLVKHRPWYPLSDQKSCGGMQVNILLSTAHTILTMFNASAVLIANFAQPK